MGKEIKVLLVDDEPDFTMSLEFWLKKGGYVVRVARRGDDALKAIRSSRPDVIFLDKRMPGDDGVATLAKIKEMDASIPVVMMSAYVEDIEKKEGDASGIAAIFYKGDDFSKIPLLIRSVLK